MCFTSDMALREADPLAVLKAFVEQSGGQKAASVKLGCSPQFISNILNGHKGIPDAMLGKLGLRRAVAVEKAS